MTGVRLAEWSPLACLGPNHHDELDAHVAAERDRLREAPDGWAEYDSVGIASEHRRWDSTYFGCPMVRIKSIEPGEAPADAIATAADAWFTRALGTADTGYAWCEVPVAATSIVQGLCAAGFRLVETRTTWVWTVGPVGHATETDPVRAAGASDIEAVRSVAATARNPWDRYHADPFYSGEVADAYLATYAQACVETMADVVLVPDPGDGRPAGAFMALAIERPPACPIGGKHACSLPRSIGRVPLVSVGPDRRGWHARLTSATMRRLAAEHVDVAVMTTQLANRAVTVNVERLGWRLGHATHVFARSRGGLVPGPKEGR